MGDLHLDWLQIEVTTHCNAACTYCPRTVFRDNWINRHLDKDAFDRLTPYFKHTKLVFLQGWGEPFTNPRMLEMAIRAKNDGCLVGATTNGMLIDTALAEAIVEAGVDILALSLAGIGNTNDRWRRGTQYEKVLASLRELDAAKRRRGSSRPAIHIAYLLMRSALDELPEIPQKLYKSGADQMVISTLDFVPSPELAAETLFFDDEREAAPVRKLITATIREGRKKGLAIHAHLPIRSRPFQTCTENATRSLFVSAEGSVSPCVFTNLPLTTALRALPGRTPINRMVFGNINETPLEKIWVNDEYKKFRASFTTGDLAPSCRSCPKRCGEDLHPDDY